VKIEDNAVIYGKSKYGAKELEFSEVLGMGIEKVQLGF
jgi:hypothetical protein